MAAGLAPPVANAAQGVQLPPASRQSGAGVTQIDPAAHSAARVWNEALLGAIRQDTPRPSVHARNLFHVSAAMYDAWAAYSPDLAWLHDESMPPAPQAARREALSYAAYRLIGHRFEGSPAHPAIQAQLDSVMAGLGFDSAETGTSGDSPAALGNRVAETYIQFGLGDGSNEPGNYSDTLGYNPINVPMLVQLPGTGGLADINRWQPLIPPGAPGPQTFLTPHWYGVEPFAIERPPDGGLYLDPGTQPLLGGPGDAELRANVIELIEFGATLDPQDGATIDISPGARGNNTLGSNDGDGHALNPATGAPYATNPVLLGDWSRVLAEFWADGPKSSTPPGHWNEIANSVTDAIAVKRVGGDGPPVSDLEWDIKLYLALNGAVHDAAIAGWEVKYVYESARPITLIRGMAEFGQSSDDTLASWHPDGLPLLEGLIELVTVESTAPGERHEHLAGHVGEVAVRGWRGHPADPETQVGGVGWVRAVEWLPYQARNFVTPPFGGYVSGHSTFSRSAAEVLAGFTGSEYFPGGLGEFTVEVGGEFELDFEYGPSEPVTLQWATYFDASDEAGLSRIYGGIHPSFDDLPGRIMGHDVGREALEAAFALFAEPQGGAGRPIAVPTRAPWSITLLILATGLLGWRRLASS
ncbi:MAG: hypothetical protein GVY32_08695 [Gammaproteobacteria bacterium]|jgi:hypothetical protein|nr:hypothetical protein [Gammaproteobacteria bacterium]